MKALLSIFLVFLLLGCSSGNRSKVTQICTQVSKSCTSLGLPQSGASAVTEQKEPASSNSNSLPVSVMDFSISLLTN
ncbi:MAG: hypothetical protein KGO92_13345 [Bacteroidota bacterium]|nr:hypothetical protein [Bacteroidota bacterium]